ncbi:amino acid ABC transporter permease [Mesorhizobium sp. M7A.F.Ca.US.006.01.1.1]|uniref:amino acid ABC transporter permease n=1 Tax=Mesorhizobium sp. M7A.F.Ca.US.006.01.1.1 TaxID=2496707 RepID=UPI000FCC1756|nr:amino acid ABC transporter permease [Mesorhizobium sp. M7A.F.Ca.US.006.01.1.1]RUZ76666.1 amino acid ABC transporter permease [Mesorhizobium sp. M7A.F.Ca.US.006.01.1.1]
MSISDAVYARPWRSSATLRTLKTGLFGTPLNSVITIVTVALLGWIVPPLLRWGIFDATWTGTSADCALANGACWAFVGAKFRFILFAFYPPALQWRPLVVMVLLLGLLVITAQPRFWRKGLLVAWFVVVAVSWSLMSGTLVPPAVPSNQWGGLAVTLFVWSVCFGLATPLAILLALARRSSMGGLRTLAIAFIELMRGTPMVAILYVAMLILPMAVPNGQLIDKNVRAMIMITLFWSAYVAEVVRAGLQAIPAGQHEAATALGLGYWRTMQLVVLPQALRLVIPGMVNLAIGFLLATSLLAVIGIFDLLNAARSSAADPQWLGYYDEAYLFAALIYFVLCFGGSRYSLWLETYLRRSQRH